MIQNLATIQIQRDHHHHHQHHHHHHHLDHPLLFLHVVEFHFLRHEFDGHLDQATMLKDSASSKHGSQIVHWGHLLVAGGGAAGGDVNVDVEKKIGEGQWMRRVQRTD